MSPEVKRKTHKLGELRKNSLAMIVKVGRAGDDVSQVARLMEMGLLEGSSVEVVHEAPFGADPIAIRVRGILVALRRSEANAVEVLIHD